VDLKVGDLVRYTKSPKAVPPNVLPINKKPLGIVVGIEKLLTSNDPDRASIFTTVHVIWSDFKWNADNGMSKECESDLVIVQRCAQANI
tara:strand:+ start:4459 stop:4725 length:267 start_codon:yes stop_codon:yes gene_type:complete